MTSRDCHILFRLKLVNSVSTTRRPGRWRVAARSPRGSPPGGPSGNHPADGI